MNQNPPIVSPGMISAPKSAIQWTNTPHVSRTPPEAGQVCAALSGAKNYIAIAEWADRSSQSMLAKLWCPRDGKTGKIVPPSEPTIRLFLGEVDAEAVDKTVNAWLERQAHLLSALIHHEQVVLAQVQVDAKSNEIPAVKLLLEPLDMQGAVVTADAMHTQKSTATFIVHEKKSNYFFTVKDNQHLTLGLIGI